RVCTLRRADIDADIDVDKDKQQPTRPATQTKGAARERTPERKVITTNDTQHNATIHVGDALDILTAMPDATADCIVTSPPYWAKRDYGITGQYGHEPDPAGYIATMVAVFSQARRVLADDGTCWLNLGDSYSAGSGTPHGITTPT